MFERSVEALELAHHGAVREWWEGEERAGRGGRLPRVPAMKQMLPRSAALDELERHVPDRKLAAALLDHWLKRRAAEGGPLLQRLWFEQPWKVRVRLHAAHQPALRGACSTSTCAMQRRDTQLHSSYSYALLCLAVGRDGGSTCRYLCCCCCCRYAAQTIAFARHAGEDDDLDDLLPFTAEEPRSAPPGKGPRRGGARRRVTHDDALDVLIALRSELEVRPCSLHCVFACGLL